MGGNDMETKQQQRAAFALKALEKFREIGVKKEYSQFIVGMPNMILSNGLGQSLAFLKAKSSKEERNFVFFVLKKYLLEEYKSDFTNVQDDFSFLEKINSVSQSKYIKMQEEVLKMLEWLKRYARAFEQADKKE